MRLRIRRSTFYIKRKNYIIIIIIGAVSLFLFIITCINKAKRNFFVCPECMAGHALYGMAFLKSS